jgi:hypothetical protein
MNYDHASASHERSAVCIDREPAPATHIGSPAPVAAEAFKVVEEHA